MLLVTTHLARKTGPSPVTLSTSERKRLARAIATTRDYQALYGRKGNDPTTARDIQVLLALAELGQASASEAGRRLGRDRASVTRAMERLRAQELIRRVESKGRRQPHELTAAGSSQVRKFLGRMD
jgi:DNA-binding MarR family transcriptional regulator